MQEYNSIDNPIKEQNLSETLSIVKQSQQGLCVTLILNTHKTKPDNQQDPILLKNLIKEADTLLEQKTDKKTKELLLDKINELADGIIHNFNTESMILFVNEQVTEVAKLPISVDNRVIVSDSFDTRDLIRAMQWDTDYYILVLSREQARLILAHNDLVLEENVTPFPMKNTSHYTTDRLKLTTAQGQDHLIEEFFNIVDKEVQQLLKENEIPLVLITEERNQHHYYKVTDKNAVIAYINQNRDEDAPHHLVTLSWDALKLAKQEAINQRIEEIQIAVSQNKLLTDINEIFSAIKEGKGKTLFVDMHYYQSAWITQEGFIEIPMDDTYQPKEGAKFYQDMIDDIIEANQSFKGETVFLSAETLNGLPNLALVTRY